MVCQISSQFQSHTFSFVTSFLGQLLHVLQLHNIYTDHQNQYFLALLTRSSSSQKRGLLIFNTFTKKTERYIYIVVFRNIRTQLWFLFAQFCLMASWLRLLMISWKKMTLSTSFHSLHLFLFVPACTLGYKMVCSLCNNIIAKISTHII